MDYLKREMLLGEHSYALGPLFEAFTRLREDARDWVADASADFSAEELELAKPTLERVAKESLYTVAGCIVVVGDIIAQEYVLSALGDEKQRNRFGDVVKNGQTFGAALQAGGNAFRHYAAWVEGTEEPHHDTDAVLSALGITERDASVPLRILDLVPIRSKQGFEAELDLLFTAADDAKP